MIFVVYIQCKIYGHTNLNFLTLTKDINQDKNHQTGNISSIEVIPLGNY